MSATHYRSIAIPVICVLLAVIAYACGGDDQKQGAGKAQSADSARTYIFSGIPLSIDSAKQMVTIDHEQIGDYMEPMTMPFKLADTALYGKIKIKERQRFTLEVAYNMAKITGVE
jgi:Cu/Ag efflux protein CusF